MRMWMLVLGAVLSWPAVAGTPLPEGPHIVVSGRGEAAASPDQARVVMTFEKRAAQPLPAKEAVDRAVSDYLAVLAEFEVDPRRVTASDLRASEDYDYSDAGKRLSRGYTAQRQVTAVLRDVSRLDALLDAGLRAGASGVGEVTFESSRASELRAEAKRKAVLDARSKAEESARAFGARIGAIYSIDSINSRYANAWGGGATLDRIEVTGTRRDGGRYLQASVEYNESVSAVFELQR